MVMAPTTDPATLPQSLPPSELSYASAAALEIKDGEPANPVHGGAEVEAPDDESRHHVTGIKLGLILLGLALAVLLISLDSAVLATAIPTITNEFNSLPDVGWYGSAYLITICACQPLAGKIINLYSLKWSYLSFLALFEIGSLICAVAPSSVVLIIGRFVAGLGSAGLLSGAIVIIAYIAPLQSRPAYMGIIMGSYSLASVVGPVIGGALTQHVSWRWCFYINLPLGGVTLGILLLVFHPPARSDNQMSQLEKLKNLDILGFLLFSPAIVMLLLALQWGGSKFPWHSATIIGLFCGAGGILIIFAAWQWHLQDAASIPPSVLTQRTVGLGALSAVLANGGINIINYWLPIWFQVILGSSPTLSGVQFIPTVLANTIISIVAGGAVTVFGYYNPLLLIGMILSAVSAGLFITFTPATTRAAWIGYQVLAGFGHGLVIQMPLTAVQAVLPLSKIPAGTTLLIFSQFLGGAVFLAIAQGVFQTQLVEQFAKKASDVDVTELVKVGVSGFRKVVTEAQLPRVLDAYNVAIVDVFWIAAAGAIVAFVASLGMQWVNVKPPKTTASLPQEQEKGGVVLEYSSRLR